MYYACYKSVEFLLYRVSANLQLGWINTSFTQLKLDKQPDTFFTFTNLTAIHICSGNIRVAQKKSILELISPWISSQNSKLHSVHYYRSTKIRAPSDHYKETWKKNQQVLHLQTLHYAVHPPRGMTSFWILSKKLRPWISIELCRCSGSWFLPLPCFCRSRWDHSCPESRSAPSEENLLPVSQNHITRFFNLQLTFGAARHSIH